MRMFSLFLVATLLASATAFAQREGNDDFFHLGPDSLRQEGVPHGEATGPHVIPS